MDMHASLRQFEADAGWLLEHWEALEQWEMLRAELMRRTNSAVERGARLWDRDAQGDTVWQHIEKTRVRLHRVDGDANIDYISDTLDQCFRALDEAAES